MHYKAPLARLHQGLRGHFPLTRWPRETKAYLANSTFQLKADQVFKTVMPDILDGAMLIVMI